MSVSNLKIVQLNMGRASAVNDQLLEFCQHSRVDVALLQEPYTNRGKLSGFEVSPFRCFLSKGTSRAGRPEYSDVGAAIVVFNPNLVVASRDSGRVENFVSVDLDCGTDGVWTLISGYFKYRVPTYVHVTALERLIEHNDNSLLIGLDANAFSTRWYSRINDRRGEVLTEFIDLHRLHIANKRSVHTTFRGPRGKTNIDVTLTSGQILTRVREWTVLPGITSSDHQLIRFELDAQPRRFVHRPPRYNMKRAQAEMFRMEFQAISERGTRQNHDEDEMAQDMVADITAAADAHIPRSRQRVKVKPPWWTEGLNAARRDLRRATRRVDDTVTRAEYNSLRNKYTALLRTNKRESWRSFCSTEGKLPWGKLYKWLKHGGGSQSVPVLLLRPDGTQCRTLNESVDSLLNTLIPNEPAQADPPQTQSRDESWTDITAEALRAFAWTIAPDRAPGADCISGRMIRVLWQTLSSRLLELVNRCMRYAKFPNGWKSATVVPILKGQDRDLRNPKSYRPVSLLPVLGKVLEKAINDRLRTQITPRLSGKQYGFTPGRSTQDAIGNLLTWSSLREERYVLTVFLDISGAFDNLKWSALQEDLAALGASAHTRAHITEYLRGRTATMIIGGVSKTVRVTKGCPQGSILGPVLWNVTIEALLRVESQEYVNIQAYADDIAVSVAGSTRTAIIHRAEQALQPILAWADSRGLSFSAQKSAAMMTKGFLAPGFTLAFGQERIVSVHHTKYLGLTLDCERKWDVHIELLSAKSDDMFSRLRGTMGAGWGIRRVNLMTLYRGVFLPRIGYGASFWAHAASSRISRQKLGKLQRRILVGLTSAYRTTSTDALQVLAGVLPLDLELKMMATKEDSRQLPERVRRATTNAAYEQAVDEWQERWSNSQKGRWTHSCFPDVRIRMNSPLAMGHEVAQFLTGHGNFRAKLAYFGKQPTALCRCGTEDEDVEHVMFRCTRHTAHRAHLELAVLRSGHLWPCTMTVLVSTRSLYSALDRFAKTAAYYEEDD